MAITKILTINDSGEKFAGKHLQRAIEYIIEPSKTQGERFVTGMNCQPREAFAQMIATKQKFDKTNRRQGYHHPLRRKSWSRNLLLKSWESS